MSLRRLSTTWGLSGYVCLGLLTLGGAACSAHHVSSDIRASAIAFPSGGTAPLEVRFDGTNSAGLRGLTEYHWDFGDGDSGDGIVVDHVFASAGAFRVRLRVADAIGEAAETVLMVPAVAPESDTTDPIARIRASVQRGSSPLLVDLDASESTDDRGITAYRWSFDDDSQASGLRIGHVFARPGTHTARLTVADAAGHRASAAVKIEVAPGPPSQRPKAIAHVSAARTTAPATIDFDGGASSDDRSIVQYLWDFGDGTTAREHWVRHRYARAGHYTARLTVFDDSGQSDEARVIVEVTPPEDVAERVLFDDALTQGVTDTSWALVTLQQDVVHAGHTALAVVPGRDGAFRLTFTPTSLDGFDRVRFWIKSEEAERIAVRAMFDDEGREILGPAVPLTDRLLAGEGGMLEGVWREGVVPIESLGSEGRPFIGLVWQASSDDRPLPFYLDEISLLRAATLSPALSQCAIPPPIRGAVTSHDGQLEADGVSFRAVGVNMYYLQRQLARHLRTGDPSALEDVHHALEAAACSGATVIRLMGFNDGDPDASDAAVIQTGPGTYREEGLRGLDLALAEAHAHGLRVILTLTNNWSAFGGLPQYARWAGVDRREVVATPEVREWLAEYARMLTGRVNVFTGAHYRDDPTILAVELANELRCRHCEPGADATSFQLALAHEVAAAWPGVLVADGGEGFDDDPALYPGLEDTEIPTGEEGTSFHRLAESDDIDLLSYHLYPDEWHLTASQADAYIDAHETIARHAGKVAYLGEFGEQTGDIDRAFTYDRWLDRLFVSNAGALALAWQLTYPGRVDNDGFALVPGESALALGSLARHAHAMNGSGLDGVNLTWFGPGAKRPTIVATVLRRPTVLLY